MARSHVPKFGNWDGDSVPYTAYFDNARKERTGGGLMINPNDPEQNPEAFNLQQRNAYGQQKSRKASESGSDESTSGHSLVKPRHRRGRNKSSSTDTASIKPSLRPNRMNHADDYSSRSTSVPKFGEWDERDPRSGEGFTLIFNKVKEEKHVAASKFPRVSVQTPKNDSTLPNKNTKSKKFCCCLF